MITEVLGALKLTADVANGAISVWKGMNGRARRRELGAWLTEMGDLVAGVADSIEEGRFPHASCAKMGYIVDQFDSVLGNALDGDRSRELRDRLNEARNIERLFYELRSVDAAVMEDSLSRMRECAGILQGAGSVMSAS